MILDVEMLDRTPSEGARVLALALLADASEAAARLQDRSDEEALHDFRVALRRLRSNLRAWRPALGRALRKKDDARLRKIARATNQARDSEVLLKWVASLRNGLDEKHRAAADWMCSRLDRRLRHGDARVASQVMDRLERASAKMEVRLAEPAPSEPPGTTFGAALAGLVRSQARSLRQELSRVSSAEAVAHVHRARISGKRLRYLLEPLRGTANADSSAAVRGLKALQDLLGELHDAHVATAELAASRVKAAADHLRHPTVQDGPGLRPGLLAIERAARERARRAFQHLEEEVLEKKAVSVLDPVYAVAIALEEHTSSPDGPASAQRRRFLLTELPAPARWGRATEIEKGWLAGDRPRECFGVARTAEGESFFRAIFVGGAGSRRQRTEEVSRAVFESFWPLTEGQRIHKRCYVAPGELGWRFDEYLDRQLALAVAEPTNEAIPPAWLEPYLVREVTEERAYHDEALARRPPRAKRPRPIEAAPATAPHAQPEEAVAAEVPGPEPGVSP